MGFGGGIDLTIWTAPPVGGSGNMRAKETIHLVNEAPCECPQSHKQEFKTDYSRINKGEDLYLGKHTCVRSEKVVCACGDVAILNVIYYR